MTEQPQTLYITPEQADSIVDRALLDMVQDETFDVATIALLNAHLRATLAPLVKAETGDAT